MKYFVKNFTYEEGKNLEWYRLYCKAQKIFPFLVEIEEIDYLNNKIIMKYIEGLNLHEEKKSINIKDMNQIINSLIHIIISFYKKKVENLYLIHLDLSLDNIIICDKIKIIDPNAVIFKEQFDYLNFYNSLILLKKAIKENNKKKKIKILLKYQKHINSFFYLNNNSNSILNNLFKDKFEKEIKLWNI
jgi:hypothetical protein